MSCATGGKYRLPPEKENTESQYKYVTDRKDTLQDTPTVNQTNLFCNTHTVVMLSVVTREQLQNNIMDYQTFAHSRRRCLQLNLLSNHM